MGKCEDCGGSGVMLIHPLDGDILDVDTCRTCNGPTVGHAALMKWWPYALAAAEALCLLLICLGLVPFPW